LQEICKGVSAFWHFWSLYLEGERIAWAGVAFVAVVILFNEELGHAFVSVDHLAFRLGVGKSTIKRALSLLVNKEKLITRSLRNDDPAISRATELFWDKIHARRVKFESASKKPNGRVARGTVRVDTLETDIEIADTLGTPSDVAPPRPFSGAGRSGLDVENIAVALLRDRFSDHPTCLDSAAERIMHKCVRVCFDQIHSPELALAILEWVCDAPSNENKRSSLRGSNKLGGYINSCFAGWSKEFKTLDEGNHPSYEDLLNSLCVDGDVFFSREHVTAIQPFRAWLADQLGKHLISVAVTEEDTDNYVRVGITEDFKAARLLEIQDSEQPNPLVDGE
jgi:hypothetical protein